MATNNLFGNASLGVVVYGPDGKAYGSPAQAIAAGVTNYTMSPPAGVIPTPAPAAPAYTQTYIPGNYTPSIPRDDDGNLLPQKYGDPIYSAASGKNEGGGGNKLIGIVGKIPVVSGSAREGNYNVSWQDDPNYARTPQANDFLKRIASGEVQPAEGGKGYEYTSYDPTTNTVTFYDLEGNITQQGQRNKGSLGFLGDAASGILTEISKNDLSPLTAAIMLGMGGAGLLTSGVSLAAAPGATAGLLGSPFAPIASAAGSSAGYLSAANAAGLGSSLAGLGSSPFAPAASVAGSIPGYVGAAEAGGGDGRRVDGRAGAARCPAPPAADRRSGGAGDCGAGRGAGTGGAEHECPPGRGKAAGAGRHLVQLYAR